MSSQSLSASYSSSGANGYEIWSFSGAAAGSTQFYIRYDVSGNRYVKDESYTRYTLTNQSYYDPGNSINYQITSSSSSTSSTRAASSSTTTRTSSSSVTSVTSSRQTITTSSPSTSTVIPVKPPPIVPTSYPYESPASPLTGCNNWNGLDNCPNSDTTDFASSAENRRWQTPPRGSSDHQSSYNDYRDLIGYADLQYNPSRTSAAVVIYAASRTSEPLLHSFNNGPATTNNIYQVNSSFAAALAITISTASGKTLTLDPINFIWQSAPLTAAQSTFENGQKGAIVELFGWPWNDIAKECVFLGKAGYMGVKIWPPNEHVWGSNYVC